MSGLLATACTPADARQTVYNNNAAAFSVDRFVTGSNNIPSASDNIHHCSDQKPIITISPPPNDTCANSDNNGQGCLITATITQGTYPLSSSKIQGTAVFTVNGQTIKSFSLGQSPQTISFYYLPSQTGSVTINGTVTDSVLYQNSDSITFNTISSSAPGPTKQPKNKKDSTSTGTTSVPIVGGGP